MNTTAEPFTMRGLWRVGWGGMSRAGGADSRVLIPPLSEGCKRRTAPAASYDNQRHMAPRRQLFLECYSPLLRYFILNVAYARDMVYWMFSSFHCFEPQIVYKSYTSPYLSFPTEIISHKCKRKMT